MIYITLLGNPINDGANINLPSVDRNSKAMQNKGTIENRLMKEILDLTLSFQREFPVIYDNLLETPLFLDYEIRGISEMELEGYHKFLMTQLRISRER